MEESIKIHEISLLLSLNNSLESFMYIMNRDSQWLLMTYYCPTHGSEDRCEPLQISPNELKKVKSEYHDQLTKNT